MRLELEVRRFLDLEAIEHGITIFSFRVWTRAQFRRADGWTQVFPALIDTGAPFSVVPPSVWRYIERDERFPTALRGLVPLRSAVLKAKLAQVTCRISDLNTIASPLRFWALLAEGEVPLVLGCAGLLERAKLTLDAPRTRAWLEF
jgi:hypothetical protein